MSLHIPTDVGLDRIDDNPFQPRLSYDDERIAAIAASIEAHGLLQPPIARKVGDRYQLAFGHTRLRAFRHLRAATMPLIVRDLDDETMALHAWTENKDRKDLTAYEEAKAIERYTAQFGWSQAKAAERLGLDRSTVANKLRLMRLPEAAMVQLQQGVLSERQAMALLPFAEISAEALERELFHSYTPDGTAIKSARDLLQHAGKLDSDRLRRAVDDLLDRLTVKLDNQPWASANDAVEGTHAALCKECPLRIKAGNRCPNVSCATRKREAWEARAAADAAASFGLPAAALDDRSSYSNLSGANIVNLRAEAKRKGCGKLAVVKPGKGSHFWLPHDVPGHAGCKFVCLQSRCACKAALERSSDPYASERAMERHERARIKAELIEPATAALSEALTTPDAGAWRLLLQAINYSAASKVPETATAEQLRTIIAQRLVVDKAQIEYQPNHTGAKSRLDKLFTALDRPAPWAARKELPAPNLAAPFAGAPLDHTPPAAEPEPAEPQAGVGSLFALDDQALRVIEESVTIWGEPEKLELPELRAYAATMLMIARRPNTVEDHDRDIVKRLRLRLGYLADITFGEAIAPTEWRQLSDDLVRIAAMMTPTDDAPAPEPPTADAAAVCAQTCARVAETLDAIEQRLATGEAMPHDEARLYDLVRDMEVIAEDCTDEQYETLTGRIGSALEQLEAMEAEHGR